MICKLLFLMAYTAHTSDIGVARTAINKKRRIKKTKLQLVSVEKETMTQTTMENNVNTVPNTMIYTFKCQSTVLTP